MDIHKDASDTRTTILGIALKLFLENGYKDVSYEDLIRKTGLSKGAIYYHFKSKKDILISAFEFLLATTQQLIIAKPENQIKDYASFKKLFISVKMTQVKHFKKALGYKSLKLNKLLFFLEAINESEKLRNTIEQLLKYEVQFLEECFCGLKKHNKLPEGKEPALLAKNLFWMLQGSEMAMIIMKSNTQEEGIIAMYSQTIEDFFKII